MSKKLVEWYVKRNMATRFVGFWFFIEIYAWDINENIILCMLLYVFYKDSHMKIQEKDREKEVIHENIKYSLKRFLIHLHQIKNIWEKNTNIQIYSLSQET